MIKALGKKPGATYSISVTEREHPAYKAYASARRDAENHRNENAEDSYIAFRSTQIKSPFNEGSFDPNNPKILEQTARGKVRIAEGRKPIVTLMKDANASTFVHESGHIYLEELMRDALNPKAPNMLRDDADTVLGWLGAKSAEDIKTKHHEKFARGFEQYLREGVAPSKELAGVFARFKDWLLQIYESLKGLGAPINEDIKGVFDRMLAMEPQRTVIAAEREPGGPTIHDIHETEAREISTPAETAPKADQVAAEANRYAAELTTEVKNELETKIAQLETELAGIKGKPDAGAEPGGKTGDGAGEAGPLEPGSGKPGALTAGGASGEEFGALVAGGGGAAPEGAPTALAIAPYPGNQRASDNPDSPLAALLGLGRSDNGRGHGGVGKPAEGAATSEAKVTA